MKNFTRTGLAAIAAAFAIHAQAGTIAWQLSGTALDWIINPPGDPLFWDSSSIVFIAVEASYVYADGGLVSQFGRDYIDAETAKQHFDPSLPGVVWVWEDISSETATAPNHYFYADILTESISFYVFGIFLGEKRGYMESDNGVEGDYYTLLIFKDESDSFVTATAYDSKDGARSDVVEFTKILHYDDAILTAFWNPIPEPATGLLVISGAALLLLRRRNTRR